MKAATAIATTMSSSQVPSSSSSKTRIADVSVSPPSRGAFLFTNKFSQETKSALRDCQTGVVHINVLPSSSSSRNTALTINENCDPSVRTDLMRAFEEIDFNATVVKRHLSVPVLGGGLAFGTWQGLYLCQFDDGKNSSGGIGIRATVKASEFHKSKRGEFVAPKRGCHDATERVQTCVDITDVKMGILNVLIKHTSASFTINDKTRAEELENGLNALVPESWNDTFLEHTMEGPDDCPAHIKATILGETMNVPIRDGKLALSEKEQILVCEHRNVGGYGGGFRREFIASVNEAKAQEVVRFKRINKEKLINVSEAVRDFVTKAQQKKESETIELVHVFSPKGGVFQSVANEAEAFIEHIESKVCSNEVLKSSVIGASEMLVCDGREMFAKDEGCLECFVVVGNEEEVEVVFTAL